MSCCCCAVDNKISDSSQDVRYDPSSNGPLKNRSCTDVLCGLVFVIFLAGSGLTGYYAYLYGDPKLLIYPTDSAGHLCGYGEKSSEPFLFYFDMVECARTGLISALVSSGCPTPQVCVTTCPGSYWTFAYAKYLELASGKPSTEERKKMICRDAVDPVNNSYYKSMSVEELVWSGLCAPYYLDSTPVAGRCLPSALVQVVDSIGNLATEIGGMQYNFTDTKNNTISSQLVHEASRYLAYFLSVVEVAKSSIEDIQNAWQSIVALIVLLAVVSWLWIVLMRFTVAFMVYLSICVFIILFTAGCSFCFWKYWSILNSASANTTFTFTTDFEQYLAVKETWLAFGITTGIVLLLTLLLVVFLRKRIQIAIAIIQETSRALSYMMLTLVWPVFPFILEMAVFVYCLTVAIYLASSAKAEYKQSNNTQTTTFNAFSMIPCDPSGDNTTLSSLCAFVKFGTNDYVIYLQIFNIFMCLWMLNFVIALGHMSLAGAFASYYWAWEKPKDVPWFPVSASLWRCIRYHLGSLAFGSLLIAICQIIRLLLEYIDRKTKNSSNPIAKFIIKCLKCLMYCLEKCLKFICKNAYIMTAIYGRNFCLAAKDAMSLLLRNALRVAIIDKVTDFTLLISKLVVVGAVSTFSFFFYAGEIPYISQYTPSNLHYFYVPIILVVIAALVISTLFFSVYEMGVDAIFLCFLEDLERHDGSEEKPYYMSKNLMEILGERNEIPQKMRSNDDA